MYVNFSVLFASSTSSVPPLIFFSGLSPGSSGGVTLTSFVDLGFPLMNTLALFGIVVVPYLAIRSESLTSSLILAFIVRVTVSPSLSTSLSVTTAVTFWPSTVALSSVESSGSPTTSSTSSRVSSNSSFTQPAGTTWLTVYVNSSGLSSSVTLSSPFTFFSGSSLGIEGGVTSTVFVVLGSSSKSNLTSASFGMIVVSL